MRSPAVENEFIPCLASAIRQWIDPEATWLQYLPAALCCVWALIYFWRRRAAWDWKTHGSLLMLVSLVAAPYCWLYDQCLAIPALLDGAYATRSRNLLALLALAILVMDIEICAVRVLSPLYLWTAPAWLAWYLLRAPRANARARSPVSLLDPCSLASLARLSFIIAVRAERRPTLKIQRDVTALLIAIACALAVLFTVLFLSSCPSIATT